MSKIGIRMNHRQVEVWARKGVGLLLAFVLLTPATWADPNPALLLERMHRVIAQTSLDEPSTKPWHVKLTIELKEESGAIAEKGTVEEWWSGPRQYKRTYNFPSYAGSTVVAEDDRYITEGMGSAPYQAEYLLNQVIHPMPRTEDVDGSHLDLSRETFGKNDFDCVMLDQPIKNIAYPPFGLFPTYCLDREKDTLRLSSEFPAQTIAMNRKGIFRGKEIAIDLTMNSAGKEIANAHVETLHGRETPYDESKDASGLKAISSAAKKVEGGVIAGNILKKVPPIYPEEAKRRQASGAVILHAIIGKDGHLRFLKPMTFPDPNLVIAAIVAVRQWTYKPYLLAGEPTEVDTTITVNFNLGPPR
jgi:hypothetical protein